MNRLRIFLLKLAKANFLEAKDIYKSQYRALTLVPGCEDTIWFDSNSASAAWFEFFGTFLYELATIGIKRNV